MSTKQFDCVRMKRQIQAQMLEDAGASSPEERAAQMARRLASGPFADILRRALEAAPTGRGSGSKAAA